MWHPEKLNALKVHFPFTPTAELKVMAEEKIRALTSIKSLVKELSADPAKKVAYDRLLAAQNSPPSSPDHPPHRAPPASGSHSRAEQNTRDPLKESPERREKVVEGTLCGSGIYTWLGNARIKGSVHGSVILTVQGDLCITGDLEGKCIVRGRNIFIEGHVSGAPVVTASGRVVIEGNRGPDALIKAAGGVIVKGHDCSQSQEPRKNSYDPGKDRPYRSPFTSRSSPEDRVPPSASVGFHTNGSWRLIDGIMTTFGATRTWIDGDGDVLLILNA
ncbi:MAG TPA: polymer-forming cytoskeletal protein, partial [Alphaproteobacteria bacterium]|nr:polymer-forming cytoskeletal protein [Alphaproteobacteria bacterium]